MSELRFETLPLAAPLQRALSEKGYSIPSPIQAAAIPVLLEGNDLLACAQTGTGKTAAFALPILHRLSDGYQKPRPYSVRTLVLAPTRELAVQIADSFRAYGKYLRTSVGLVYGGVSQRPQERTLKGGLDVLVATPGRLLDLYQQNCMDLSEVDTFVLDEADHMLDMGFINDIRRIAKELPEERQTLLFSATMAGQIAKLADTLLHNPKEIRIAPAATTAEKVEQKIYHVQHENKRPLLTHLFNERADGNPDELSLVFTRTKHGANRLAKQLTHAGIPADAIHGNKSQAARQKALGRFRTGETRVLVATDVAARGIDVKDVTLVVNYDLPVEPDSYVHRIGRTARAGASGLAVSFNSMDELPLLRSIEKLIRQNIPVEAEHPFHADEVASRYQNPGRRSDNRPQFGNKQGKRRNNANRRPKGGHPEGNSKPQGANPNQRRHKKRRPAATSR